MEPEAAAQPPASGRRAPWLVVGITVAVLAAALAGSLALSRGGSDAEAAVFTYAFRTGDTKTYDFTMGMEMEGPPDFAMPGAALQTVTGTVTMRVVETHADGSATVEITYEAGGTDGFGDMPPRDTQRVRIGPDGRILSSDGAAPFPIGIGPGAGPVDGAEFSIFPSFPADAIAPGDTWEHSYDVPLPGSAPATLAVKGKHEGFEDTRFGRAARMRQETRVPMSFRFPMGAMFGSLVQGLQDAFPEARPSSPPPDLSSAVITFDGALESLAEALVLTGTSELIEAHATTEMNVSMNAAGFPAGAGAGGPADGFTMSGIMKLDLVRTS